MYYRRSGTPRGEPPNAMYSTRDAFLTKECRKSFLPGAYFRKDREKFPL